MDNYGSQQCVVRHKSVRLVAEWKPPHSPLFLYSPVPMYNHNFPELPDFEARAEDRIETQREFHLDEDGVRHAITDSRGSFILRLS